MSTIRSKTKTFKIGINITLLVLLTIILAQNIQPVDIDILFWQLHIPLVVLLLATALLGALIVFVFVLILGRN